MGNHPRKFPRALRLGLLILAAAIFLAAPVLAATSIPFTFWKGLIWIKVSAQGSSEPLYFLLDSGASRTALDTKAAGRLGLQPGRPEWMVAIQGPCSAYRISPTPILALQKIPLSSATVEIDLNTLTGPLGHQVDGLIGADFFYNHAVQIDYQAQVIRIEEPGRNYFPADAADLVNHNGALCVKASINGNAPAWFRVDTGCGSALEWCNRTGSQPAAPPSAPANSAFRSTTQVGVTIGARQFDQVEAGLHASPMFPGESGLIGNALFSKTLVTIDAASHRLYMADLE